MAGRTFEDWSPVVVREVSRSLQRRFVARDNAAEVAILNLNPGVHSNPKEERFARLIQQIDHYELLGIGVD